jgi:penicillin amidase
LEFKLLGYAPERWTLLKTALVKKYMDLTLCFGEDDLEATNTLSLLGRDVFDKLYPAYPKDQSPVIPAGTQWSFRPVAPASGTGASPATGLIRQDLPEKDRTLVGSNNWAVAGVKTKSGYPILCNDPHLRLSLPSIWFESQIQAPGLNAYGVTVPGIPGLLIGFNQRTAWGVTNVGHDVLDWIRLEWTDAARTRYRFGEEIRSVTMVVDTFRVKGAEEPVYDTVRWTTFGPVVYSDADDHWNDLAMRWIGHLAPDPAEIGTFIGLNRGESYQDYVAALRHYVAPAQNFIFAAREGDVAITVNGQFPVKSFEEGRFVQQGSAAGTSWTQWIPREHLPHSHNPTRGFVSSANQHSTDPTYPYYYNSQHFDQYRGRYLNRELARMDSMTVEDMMALQQSNFSLHAAEGLPILLALLDRSRFSGEQADTLLSVLEGWNYRFDRDALAPVLFVRWWERYYRETFDELVGWQDSLPVLMPTNQRLVELSTDFPNDQIFDLAGTPEQEAAADMATRTFGWLLESWISDRASFQTWSKYKGTTIQHLAAIPAFSRQDLPVGGYKESLNAVSKQHGPSWRMVVDLGPELRAWGVFPGGQSGNPGSPFYDVSVDPWVEGRYHELSFLSTATDTSKHQVRRTLQLNPARP